MRTNVPGIGESVQMYRKNCKVSTGETIFQEKLLAVDPAFLTMFTLPLAAGDASTALDDPHSVVLAHETAQKYFGSDVSPRAMLGKRLRMHVVFQKPGNDSGAGNAYTYSSYYYVERHDC